MSSPPTSSPPTARPSQTRWSTPARPRRWSAGEGWLFSVDGEAFTADIPVAVDAGDYTVFFKAAEDAEAQALTVTVAKADVVLVPPEAMTGEE